MNTLSKNCSSSFLWTLCIFSLVLGTRGVNLKCQESDDDAKKLACEIDISYDEIASAWSMECEALGSGLKCNFEVERDMKSNVNLETPVEDKIELCSAEDSICILSSVSTHIRPLSDPATYPRTHEESVASSNKKLDKNEVKIGNHIYRRPFDQYAPILAEMLEAREMLWGTTPVDAAHQLSLAHGYLDVGIAHFSSVTARADSPDYYANHHEDSFDLNLALNAFQEAEKAYLNIEKLFPEEKYDIECSLAVLFLQWGEVTQYKSMDEADEDPDSSYQKDTEGSLRLRRAENYYRTCLEVLESRYLPDKERIKSLRIDLAHVLVRVGRYLISSTNGLITGGTPEWDSFVENGKGTAAAQIEYMSKAVAEAEEKFEEAVTNYRQALDDEKMLADRISIKNNLITALSDYGTAATYASNIQKAAELLEEAVQIAKEILPDLSPSELDFMKQLIADSLYSLANHYMQLGKYDKTKATYQDAMDCFDKFDIEVRSEQISLGAKIDDEMLEAYEKQLAEYHELLLEIKIPGRYHDEHTDPLEYGPNDVYEAGLHTTLGSIHLSRDEALLAIDHFHEALRLYVNDQTGENLDRAIADVKTSLAAAYVQVREFQKSAETYHDAMDTYREILGEGKNPITSGLEYNIDGADMLNQLLESSGLDETQLRELLSGLGFQHILDNLNVDHEQKAEVGADTKTAAADGGEKKQVHEELFDMDKLRDLIYNATSSNKEEL